jgi:hypothetical protein
MSNLSLDAEVKRQLQGIISQATDSAVIEQVNLNNALRLLSKWRSVLLKNTFLQQQGTVVMQGPLKGMNFLRESAEGCHIAKLLGCYEQPLQKFIENAIQKQYPIILNIGCAEGYYAVGMALRMPNTRVVAHDLNPKAQQICIDLANKNKVSERVVVGGLFKPSDFANFSGKQVLLMCDIEGAERELLDPIISPDLKSMDIIVESHECLTNGVTQLLIERFKASHNITLVQDDGQRQLHNPPNWFVNLAHLDQLLATWEWRSGPTPWLVMMAKHPPV